ncbi:MAG: hypothetical protein JW709_11655 [Sedimentisphaerales bacterium]|nr:hypothetical protein [Sedimentisphaerales bacterium]
MIDVKRIGYVLALALMIGLALVHLRTSHRQSVYHMTCLRCAEQQLGCDLAEQRQQIVMQLETPREVDRRIADMQLELYRPGEEVPEGVKVAKNKKTAAQETTQTR